RVLVLFELFFFFFQAEDGIRDLTVTGVQTCALPICPAPCGPVPAWDLSRVLPWRSSSARWSYGGVAALALSVRSRRAPWPGDIRSEERRVGKECGCRWARSDEKKKIEMESGGERLQC